MIPKIIHYCWFGRGEMPSLAQKCIKSWRFFLPNYELILWNEDNFDVNQNLYVKEAYENKKYAFVTDFVRLYVLHHIGGIYMDTDVEILKNLDNLLHLKAFSGFESNLYVPTGIMASEKGCRWTKELLDYYNDRSFILSDGSLDMKTNCFIISEILQKRGINLNNKYQIYNDELHLFPNDYFCPKSSTGVINKTDNTYCIHHFAASWCNFTFNDKVKHFIARKILKPKFTNFLIKTKKKLF